MFWMILAALVLLPLAAFSIALTLAIILRIGMALFNLAEMAFRGYKATGRAYFTYSLQDGLRITRKN